ncbi:23S rRNA (adenine(2030)-N(6))-methyltransferase RlmJ [Catenovulum sp. SM1970]|uniref:23S rRNA (adenine(2030)-N(6))-methyltransferase RlmJ n=1 Tax=Marinifaba aquimaris TaxID=2741323 RepID=UPI0015738BDF|nr:23S rRNA (adenine(2030)-N(6))-methyltransferase RlmJ [Marinifaba aquimaris]NTS77182.1 23S rRNA (adenine(2030)-N(6))-methyltransferase RlmJ [Marinifaba aquimaris]
MLSYRHSFHAGNYADVLKHTVQQAILDYLLLKDKPFCVVDTHAGAGAYQLDSAHAQKTNEYVDGIAKIWQYADKHNDLHELIENYLNSVKAFNQDNSLKYYPGSPWFSQQALRAGDKLFAYELHPADFDLLTQAKGRDRKVKLFHDDGFKSCLGLLPPEQKRGFIIIDPPYEVKKDYDTVVKTVAKAHKKFANGVYAIWYPVVDRYRINKMRDDLIASGITRIHCYEMGLSQDTEQHGMTSAGMIVINPPWTLKAQMEEVLPQLVDILAPEQGCYRCEEWVGE